MLDRIVQFFYPQSDDRVFLTFSAVYCATDLCNYYFTHNTSVQPWNTLFTEIPRAFAIVFASRSILSALNVALTTLVGFEDPNDLASTSVIPALSRTALIAPPAITPVPAEAGRMQPGRNRSPQRSP